MQLCASSFHIPTGVTQIDIWVIWDMAYGIKELQEIPLGARLTVLSIMISEDLHLYRTYGK